MRFGERLLSEVVVVHSGLEPNSKPETRPSEKLKKFGLETAVFLRCRDLLFCGGAYQFAG